MADDNEQQSPFTRPGFVAATVVIALIVVLGLVIVIVNTTRDDSDSTPLTSTSAETTSAPTHESPEASGGTSMCGLPGEVLEGTLTEAPAAQWQFQGTMAYPISAEFGPGETNVDGVRYCFQHSPEGALFAAANAAAMATDQTLLPAWMEYFVAEGPYRDDFLQGGDGDTSATQGARIEIIGFRLLAYDGETARIDLALRGSMSGRTLTLSMVYELVWQNGDWKLHINDPNSPIDVATIPDASGYIPWKS